MTRVALKAEERDLLCQKIVINGTMGRVAGPAVLHRICMFENKRPSFFGMALCAGFLDVLLAEHFAARCPVGVMAAYAEDPFFVNGVVARQRKFSLHVLVAIFAHADHVFEPHC